MTRAGHLRFASAGNARPWAFRSQAQDPDRRRHIHGPIVPADGAPLRLGCGMPLLALVLSVALWALIWWTVGR